MKKHFYIVRKDVVLVICNVLEKKGKAVTVNNIRKEMEAQGLTVYQHRQVWGLLVDLEFKDCAVTVDDTGSVAEHNCARYRNTYIVTDRGREMVREFSQVIQKLQSLSDFSDPTYTPRGVHTKRSTHQEEYTPRGVHTMKPYPKTIVLEGIKTAHQFGCAWSQITLWQTTQAPTPTEDEDSLFGKRTSYPATGKNPAFTLKMHWQDKHTLRVICKEEQADD